ncbi:Ger(x)C family spore germination C-terminal domain-containing protein [Fictibacillus enclensis]|uniref:Ger(x)C family spore germination protein n=1 Tax=Fictibacillus enclensis TaxID=1017270 RepID=UPI0025A25CC1|nr:Ger(x)C family spore germination C-terminal domain-containing protein [Fictibacillus enclensis]MDM5200966.1 Ger(x)C family spore germination C-terminal domain-containing protein [Fictibacillus enclensis]
MKIFLSILCILLVFSGCSSPFVEDNTVEEIAPVTFWSLNQGEGGELEITTLIPPVTNEKKRLFTLNVDLLKQGKKEFNLKFYRELKLGQLRMLIINEKLAKKEIIPLINTILSDPDVSPRLFLVLVRGSFEDFLEEERKVQKNLDYYLYRMFRHYERRNQGEMSIVNLHDFMERVYSPYSDPVLPIFKADKDNFTYDGTALFNENKYVGSINKREDQMFQLIANDHYLKNLPIPHLKVSLGQVRSKVHMQVDDHFNTLNIDVLVKGRIDEYRGHRNLLSRSEMNRMTHDIESYLQRETAGLVKETQRLKIEPLEVGAHTVSPLVHPMTRRVWLDHYEKMKVHVKYSVKIEPLSL